MDATSGKGKGKGGGGGGGGGKGKASGYSINIPRQLKKLGLTKDKYVRLTFRDGHLSGSCIDGSIFLCMEVLNNKDLKDLMTFKEPKHNLYCFAYRHPLLLTVCDDWKLRVQNVDNENLKQKFPIPVPHLQSTMVKSDDTGSIINKRGSEYFIKNSGGSIPTRAGHSDCIPTRRRTAVL